MPTQPSTPIKIAAFFLLIGGLLSAFTSLAALTVTSTSTDTESLKGVVTEIVNIILLGFSISSLLAGWFIIKMKKWAYVLGLVLAGLSSAMYLFAFLSIDTSLFYKLALSLAILSLLIHGRKDFKKA